MTDVFDVLFLMALAVDDFFDVFLEVLFIQNGLADIHRLAASPSL